MRVTVQMLDGSITPFNVRSSITIASLKTKFELWQPMRGRALLHHNVQLDDRATLGSIPGVKNGTILRVDKRVSQVKSKANRKKSIRSGPPDLEVDDDVVESIETSDNEERTSSANDWQTFDSKRKRPSIPVLDKMSDDPLGATDTNPSTGAMPLRIKKEKRTTTPRERNASSQIQNQYHRPHSPMPFFTPRLESAPLSPIADIHMSKSKDISPSRQSLMDDIDVTFLTDIDAAAVQSERSPLHFQALNGQDVSARRCDACGRACMCGENLLDTLSNRMAPAAAERTRVQREVPSAPLPENNSGHLTSTTTTTTPTTTRSNPTSQSTESNWTGM